MRGTMKDYRSGMRSKSLGNRVTTQSRNRLSLIVVFLLIVVGAMVLAKGSYVRVSSASPSTNRISAEAIQQISALEAEKESRTPAQRKIDSQLIYATKMHRGQDIAEGVKTLE